MEDKLEIHCLETILDYDMDHAEAKAYKLCCLYQDAAQSIFPTHFHYKVSKGDPRKSSLFKYCFKLLRETQHKLKDVEYVVYIRAQLAIMRALSKKDGIVPSIQPSCLVGEKAWKRYLVFKNRLDKQGKEAISVEKTGIDIHGINKIKSELIASRTFIDEKIKDNIDIAYENRTVLRWIAIRQITPYYALLSPAMSRWLEKKNLSLEDVFHIDFELYRPGITPEITEFFYEEFKKEFTIESSQDKLPEGHGST